MFDYAVAKGDHLSDPECKNDTAAQSMGGQEMIR